MAQPLAITDTDPEVLAYIKDMRPYLSQLTSYETLFGFQVCGIVDIAAARARREGVTNPNRGAMITAAIDILLVAWKTNHPDLWAGYVAEIGPAPADATA